MRRARAIPQFRWLFEGAFFLMEKALEGHAFEVCQLWNRSSCVHCRPASRCAGALTISIGDEAACECESRRCQVAGALS